MKMYYMHGEKSLGASAGAPPALVPRFSRAIRLYWLTATLMLGCCVFRTHADVSCADILQAPERYIGRQITMKGTLSANNTERKSFDLRQGNYTMKVFYGTLPVQKQALILNRKNFSGVLITVTGKVQRFSNVRTSYFITATDVAMLPSRPAVQARNQAAQLERGAASVTAAPVPTLPKRVFPTAPIASEPAPVPVNRSSDLAENKKSDNSIQIVASLVCLVVLLATIWLAFDARANRITSGKGPYSLRNGALAWVVACGLLWIVVFPYYLVRRSVILRERGKNPPHLRRSPIVPAPVPRGPAAGRDQRTAGTSNAAEGQAVVLKPGKTWYYVESDKSVGPLEEAYIHVLVKGGQLDQQRTLVWNEGLETWWFYDELFLNQRVRRRFLPATVPPLPVSPLAAAAQSLSTPEPTGADTSGLKAQPSFVKGACQHCGGHLEFSSINVGQTVDCPHCRKRTRLDQTLASNTGQRKTGSKPLPVGIPLGPPRKTTVAALQVKPDRK